MNWNFAFAQKNAEVDLIVLVQFGQAFSETQRKTQELRHAYFQLQTLVNLLPGTDVDQNRQNWNLKEEDYFPK